MPLFHDIQLDANGDLPAVTRHITGWLSVVQRVKFRLQTFLGEWILDTAKGLPFMRWRGQKDPNLQELSTYVRREILDTPGVIRLLNFSVEFLREQQRIAFHVELEVEDVAEASAQVGVTFFPFGPTTANTNPIALIIGPSKTVL
jgi:hypothetical protein